MSDRIAKILPMAVLAIALFAAGCGGSDKGPAPAPTIGPFVQSIDICPGTPTPPTPTPVGTPVPTAAPTPCAASTTVAPCSSSPFHATATMSDGSETDVTQTSFWSTNNATVLHADTSQPGVYISNCNSGVNQCPVMIGAAAGSTNSNPFTVTVDGLASCGP